MSDLFSYLSVRMRIWLTVKLWWSLFFVYKKREVDLKD